MLATTMATANAQEAKMVSGKIRCTKNSEVTLPKGMKFTMRESGMRKSLTPIRPLKAATDEELVTIKVKAICTRKPDGAVIFNKDMMKSIDFSGKEATVDVPKGTYDMYVEFYDDSHYYVYKENIHANENMELEFDQKEANIPIEFHYFDENNKELHLDIYDGKTVATPGTADNMLKLTSIIHKDYGFTTFMMSFGYKSKGYLEDFYINKLSDKYFIGQTATIGKGSHYYALKSIVTDFEKKIFNNDYTNLKRLETEFTLSPGLKDIKEYINLPGVETSFLQDGYSLGDTRMWGFGSPEDNGKVVTYIDCPAVSATDECQMNMAVRPIASDGVEIISVPGYEDEEDFTFILTPLAIGNAKQEVKYHVSGSDISSPFNVPVGEVNYKFYPGHPEFSFIAPEGKAHFGNNVPVTAYCPMRMTSGSKVYAYDKVNYLGRWGEVRETDVKLAQTVKEETPNGTLVTVTNNNVEIDGMEGKNVTEVLYNMTKEDNTAPTFQMLTFKDAESNICDRFKDIQGAKMIAAGGDFAYVENNESPYIGHFTCDAPASVKAYYAPHGTDSWTELAVNEDKEKYFMPAFGHFYEADLSGVKAENQWVDVRLEIADATGNYQKQTISPAFFVELSSGISKTVNATANAFVVIGKTVKLADGRAARITVRSIDGRTLQSTYTNVIDMNGMTAGMYIVTATADNGNVVSTKVAM